MSGKHNDSTDNSGFEEAFFDSSDSDSPAPKRDFVGAEEEGELERIFQPAGGRARHPLLAGTVAGASLLVLWMMRADIAYFFQGSKPTSLGDAAQAIEQGKLHENTYVEIKGLPDLNTKATVNRKGCGLAPNTGTSTYYNFYIVQNTNDSLVVRRSLTAKERQKEMTHPVLELDVSGRLVRFSDQKEFFAKYRRYVNEASKTFPALRREYEIPRAEIRRNVGKGRVTVRDTKGRRVVLSPDSSIGLYVIFPDELEYRLDRTFTLSPDHVTFVGGAGPKCPSDFSGSAVVLIKDPKALDFGPDIKSKARIVAPAPKTAGAAGRDLRIFVPPDTKVYDSATGDPIPFDKGILTIAAGGPCGKPGQTRTVNLESHPLSRLSAAKAYVRQYGIPYGLMDQDSDSFFFILKGPPKKLEAIVKAQRRTAPYSASSRTDWFEARWSELKLVEDTLVIRPARPSHPPRYVLMPLDQNRARQADATRPTKRAPALKKGPPQDRAPTISSRGPAPVPTKEQKQAVGSSSAPQRDRLDRVRKESWEGEVRFLVDRLDHATVNQARTVPRDAWLLMEGVRPTKFWYFPVLGLLLALFALYNLWAIRSYFKYVRGRSGQDSTAPR